MKKLKNIIISLIFPIIFLLLWQMLANKIDKAIVLPGIPPILKILLHPTENLIGIGSILRNIYISFLRVSIGYGMATIIAIPLGILIGSSNLIEKMLMGFLNLFRPVPPLAWVPLVLAWFGIASIATIFNIGPDNSNYVLLNGIKISMVFIIFMGSFFPILTNTIFGIKGVRKTLIDSLLVHGASKMDILLKVLLPGGLPSIVTGLRVGLGVAWMSLVCSEMLPGSVAGIGYLITHAYQLTRIDIVIAGIISISAVSFLIDNIFRIIERRFFKWQSLSK